MGRGDDLFEDGHTYISPNRSDKQSDSTQPMQVPPSATVPLGAGMARTVRVSDAGESTQSVYKATKRPFNGVTLENLVHEAYDNDFSDVHLGVGEVPRFRDRGRLEPGNHPETDQETFESWLEEILTPEQIQKFYVDLEFDGAMQYEGFVRVRINVFVSLRGPAMVLRLIPLRIKTMEELYLPMIFRDLCHYHKGLILVTGPTGSGKSTTLAAMIDYINSEMPKHIVAIEDPVEFVHKSRKAMIRQREVGIHTHKFDNALKASLREDPDIILIGEMRDRETVNTALKAAQTRSPCLWYPAHQ